MTRRRFPLHAGVAAVTAIETVTPSMRRFTLRADAFADFGVEQPGEIVTLGWPAPGRELVLPRTGWRFPPGNEDQHWRNYTVRSIDPARSQIDIDFFLHGDAGRAAAWAERAQVGDAIGFAGPRLHWKGGNHADWSLLVADETGLPALLAILETLPAGHRTTALAEVSDNTERQEVETAADVDLHWLVRGGRPPGTTTAAGRRRRRARACRAAAGACGAAARRWRCARSATTCASPAAASRCSATGSTTRRPRRCGDPLEQGGNGSPPVPPLRHARPQSRLGAARLAGPAAAPAPAAAHRPLAARARDPGRARGRRVRSGGRRWRPATRGSRRRSGSRPRGSAATRRRCGAS